MQVGNHDITVPLNFENMFATEKFCVLCFDFVMNVGMDHWLYYLLLLQ